jgi:hypothetical protein
MADRNSTHSTLRERIVEHAFVGDALRRLWQRGVVDVEVLRSEFDAYGYDLVLARGRIVRHIQFKTGQKKPRNVTVALQLADKPSGCVVWITVTPDLDLGPFYWLGDEPKLPLPTISHYPMPRRATHNAEGERPVRQNHRQVPISAFRRMSGLDEVLEALFGDLPNGEAMQ